MGRFKLSCPQHHPNLFFYEDYIINNPTANIRLPRTEYNLNNKVLSEDDILQAKLNKIEKLKKWSTLFE